MEILVFIIVMLIMVAGLIGAILPVIPSVPLVYAGYAIFGLATGWKDYGAGLMIVLGMVTVLLIVVDYVAGAIGARKFGGSAAGMIGSVVGAVIGLMIFNIIGLIGGTFAGALLGELIWGKTWPEACRAGFGAFLGFLAGSLFKFVTSALMIVIFLWKVMV